MRNAQMRILLLTVGTRGDIQPFVALGRRLMARGHSVTLAAPSGFRAMAEAAGLTFHALPMDAETLLQEPEMKAVFTSIKGKLKAFRWVADLMNRQLSDTWALGLDLAPDVILSHFKGSLGPQLARRLGVVSIPVMLQPGFVPTTEYPQFLVASHSLGRVGNLVSHWLIQSLMRMGTRMMIRRWVKATGTDIGPKMDPLAGFDPRGPARRLHAYSPEIVPRPASWPGTEVQAGYLFTEPEDFTPPDDLAAFLDAGDTPIYVGFGSMPGIDHARTTDALVGALARTGLRAVVATGWGGIAGFTGDNVHVVDAVPHSWLFPRVAAVVHHGGSGTTHEGLRWGRPSVVCPLSLDQPFFGARVQALGAGPAPIRQKRLTADGLARALDAALAPETRSCAEEIGARLRHEDGVAAAVGEIERG
jgi:sterol 3beta-glucosyltransferase